MSTDKASIQKRLFDKIDVELAKMRNRAKEHTENNKNKLKELEKAKSKHSKK